MRIRWFMYQRYKRETIIADSLVELTRAMSQRVKRHWALVNFLTQQIPLTLVKSILSALSEEQVNAIGEIAVNTLYGIIPIKPQFKKTLKRYSDLIEFIGEKTNSIKKRKKAIVSNPKAVVLLLTAARPVLQGFVS